MKCDLYIQFPSLLLELEVIIYKHLYGQHNYIKVKFIKYVKIPAYFICELLFYLCIFKHVDIAWVKVAVKHVLLVLVRVVEYYCG